MAAGSAELVESRLASLKRTSKDWVDAASSIESQEGAKRLKDLNHPPHIKKTMRNTGLALAAAPEPVTTVAGLALLAGSLVKKREPDTLKTIGKELKAQLSELSVLSEDLALSLV